LDEKKKGKERVRGSRGNICENKGECNYKTVEKDNMSQGKISIASRKQFHMQNPTEFDYYQRSLHVRKFKGRISKPRGYLHRCIRSLSLTKYNNATRNASQTFKLYTNFKSMYTFPRDDVDQTPTSPLNRYSWE